MKRALRILVPVAVVVTVSLLLWQRSSRAVIGTQAANACFGNLNATTYPSGFSSSDFSVMTAAKINSGAAPLGGLQLDTALTPLDPQHIVLPFDQDVKIHYVYRNAGASQSLGWFYFDQLSSYLTKPATDPTAKLKVDSNSVPIFFKDLWVMTGSNTVPDITIAANNYVDGGSYPRIHNLLEGLMSSGKGGMIFKLCDDDTDNNVYPNGGTPAYYSPVPDVSTTNDGIPDYDVNGNGVLNEVADRTVDLGIIQGNREIVFFVVNYNQLSINNVGMGLTGTAQQTPRSVPWFTKDMLNPDFGARSPGSVIRKTAIGCARDDSACYTSKGGDLGWLDQAALDRLKAPANAADYNLLNIAGDSTVRTIKTDADGNVPHFVVFAPNSDPNRWLMALDNQPEYTTTTSDADYDDIVFLIERTNGGSVQSNLINSDVPAADRANTAISKIKVTFTASFPIPGCTGITDAEVRIYYSVDNKVTWTQVPFSSKTSGTATIDVLGAGQIGHELYWRADFVSPNQTCQPVLNTFNMGYEAVEHGEFKFAAPIPLSNMAYSGSLETPPFPTGEPTVTANDFSIRGHFYAERLYDPANPSVTSLLQEWDAGDKLAAISPDARTIYTTVSGAATAFTTTNLTALKNLVLPTAVRTTLSSGALVYDYNEDSASNDTDAQFLIQWTRGWEYPSGITFTPAQSALKRGWKLGPIHNSSPAIIGPPPRPVWIDGTAAPAAMITKHNAFRTANATRSTVALVGAQDGMLHAFDAGQFRYGADSSCTSVLNRGCFAGSTDASRYGSGDETWAFIPPSQLGNLKNIHPQSRGYNPSSNPPAEVDGSVAVEDIYYASTSTFKTVAFASLGRRQPYITAVDVTGTTPGVVWSNDFTDVRFNGTELAPSVGLTTTNGGTFHVVTTSGLASTATNEYLFLIDAVTGWTTDVSSNPTGNNKRIQLNTGTYSATAYGFGGYPNMVDANGDGLIDRIYAVDTSGRIFKYDITTNTSCVLGTVGESVYAGMAVLVGGNATAPRVKLYLGGGPNPDGTNSCSTNSECTGGATCQNMLCTTGTAPLFHLKAYEDADTVGTCSSANFSLVYTSTLPAGQRLWAAPYVNSTTAFYATAGTRSASVCLTANGDLFELSTTGDGSGNPSSSATPTILAGSPVSSLRVYDGHALINTIGGGTVVAGSGGWNNSPIGGNGAGGSQTITSLPTLMWSEQ